MSSTLPRCCDVAIVGAGPTGLMLANLLALYGVRTTLVEKRVAPFSEPRAIAFDPETLRLFQTIGCYDALRSTLELDVPVHYLNASGKTLAHITDCPPSFGHSGRGTFYQPELEAVLMRRLESRECVTFVRGVEVVAIERFADRVTLGMRSADGRSSECSARYVVDCSGGASSIRRQLGIEFSGDTFREKWLVIDVEGDDFEGREIQFFCDPRRPAVTLPVSNNRRRWEFLVMPGDDETKLASHASARSLMSIHGAGSADKIERSLVYTFHARFADRFRIDRVLLAGDSAHVMPPFAGQGLNSGMRDVANLAWKLEGVVGGKYDDAILDTYELERRPHIEGMTKLAIQLGRTIMPTNHIRAWLRDRLMLASWRFRRTREKYNRGEMIPKPSVKGSPLVNWGSSNHVGQMIAQPFLQQGGQSIRMDDVIGRGFAAIGVNCRVEAVLHDDDMATLATLGASLTSLSSSSKLELEYRESSGVLGEIVGGKAAVLIVRPDRFLIDVIWEPSDMPRLTWLKESYGALSLVRG